VIASYGQYSAHGVATGTIEFAHGVATGTIEFAHGVATGTIEFAWKSDKYYMQ